MGPWWIKKNRKPKSDDDAKAKFQKFYQSKEWQQLRLFKLANDPLWEICMLSDRTTAANCVDHRIPLALDWSLRLDYDNLQSLCDHTSPHNCHQRKTMTTDHLLKQQKVIKDRMDELSNL